MIKLIKTRAPIKVLTMSATSDVILYKDVSANFLTNIESNPETLFTDYLTFNHVNEQALDETFSYRKFIVNSASQQLADYQGTYSSQMFQNPDTISIGYFAGGNSNGQIYSINYSTDTIANTLASLGGQGNEGTISSVTSGYFKTFPDNNPFIYLIKFIFNTLSVSNQSTYYGIVAPSEGSSQLLNKGWSGYWVSGVKPNDPNSKNSGGSAIRYTTYGNPANTNIINSIIFVSDTNISFSTSLSIVTAGAYGLYSSSDGFIVGGSYVASSALTIIQSTRQMSFSTGSISIVSYSTPNQCQGGSLSSANNGFLVSGYYWSGNISVGFTQNTVSSIYSFNFQSYTFTALGSSTSSYQGCNGNNIQGYTSSGFNAGSEVDKFRFDSSGNLKSVAPVSATLGSPQGTCGLCYNPNEFGYNLLLFADGTLGSGVTPFNSIGVPQNTNLTNTSEYVGYSSTITVNTKYTLINYGLPILDSYYSGYTKANNYAIFYYLASQNISFPLISNLAYGSVVTSNTVTVSGLSCPMIINLDTNAYSLDGTQQITPTAYININGVNVGTNGVIRNGSTVSISLTVLGAAYAYPNYGQWSAYNFSSATLIANPQTSGAYENQVTGSTVPFVISNTFWAQGKFGNNNSIHPNVINNASPGAFYQIASLGGDNYWPVIITIPLPGYFTDNTGTILPQLSTGSGYEFAAILGVSKTAYAYYPAGQGSGITTTVGVVSGTTQVNCNITNFTYITTPNAFNFTDLTNATTCSTVTSNTDTISGMNVSNGIGVSGSGNPSLIINGTNVGASGTVSTGSTVALTLTASCTPGTLESATVTIGTFSTTWNVTTLNPTPTAFGFNSQTNLVSSTLTYSNTITISGMPASSSNTITCDIASLIINGVNSGGSGTVTNSDTVQLQMYSSSSWSTSETAHVTIGTFSTTWSITTEVDPNLAVSQATFSSYPTIFNSGMLAVGTGDFTCNFNITVNVTALPTSGIVSGGYSGGYGIVSFTNGANNTVTFGIGNSSGAIGGSATFTFTKGQSYSVVFQRSGGTVYLYVNGGLVKSYSNSTSILSSKVAVGARYADGSFSMPFSSMTITNFSITSP